MIVKVQAVVPSAYANQHNAPKTRYYRMQTMTKSKVKRDFKILLDSEIEKLRFDAFV